jgi:hypothetical protein
MNFFFFFCSTGIWSQDLHLKPLHQHFFVIGVFKIGFHELFVPDWLQTAILLISVSWVTRITGKSVVPCQFMIFESYFGADAIIISCLLHKKKWLKKVEKWPVTILQQNLVVYKGRLMFSCGVTQFEWAWKVHKGLILLMASWWFFPHSVIILYLNPGFLCDNWIPIKVEDGRPF